MGKISKVEDLIVYRKAMELFDSFVDYDLPVLNNNFAARELAKNQIRSLDSICANMEEGFGRKAGRELKQFFRISRGSAGESKGRYKRLKKFLPEDIIQKRVSQLLEVQIMLNSLVNKLKDDYAEG